MFVTNLVHQSLHEVDPAPMLYQEVFCGCRIIRNTGTRMGSWRRRTPRVSVSRSIFALVDDHDRAYFGRGEQEGDQFGYVDGPRRAGFGRSCAAEPDVLIEQ